MFLVESEWNRSRDFFEKPKQELEPEFNFMNKSGLLWFNRFNTGERG